MALPPCLDQKQESGNKALSIISKCQYCPPVLNLSAAVDCIVKTMNDLGAKEQVGYSGRGVWAGSLFFLTKIDSKVQSSI